MTETSTTETETTTETTETQELSADTETAKQLEHWKEQAKKQEQRAKANAAAAKELEQVKASMMSETEKAVAEAKAAGLAEGLRNGASKIAQAEIRAAAAGRPVDVDALLENVDAARFVDDQGEVDRAAIAAWVDRVAPAPAVETDPLKQVFPDLGQGTRGDAPLALNGDPIEKMLKEKLGIK